RSRRARRSSARRSRRYRSCRPRSARTCASASADRLRLGMSARFANDDGLAAVPAIVMANEPSELELAFQRGAADAIVKPFSMVELIARARRVAQLPRRSERLALSGSLADVELAAVLLMLEQQRMSGRIVLANG